MSMTRTLGTLALTLAAILSLGAGSARALDFVGEQSAMSASFDAFQLTPSAPSVARPILVDAAGSMTIVVTSIAKDLTVAVRSPNGTTFRVGDPSTAAFESAVTPDPADPTTAGANYLMNLFGPVAGTWTLQVAAPPGLTGPLDVLVTVGHHNDLRALLLGGSGDYPVGGPIRIGFAAFKGTARLTGLSVSGSVYRDADESFAPLAPAFTDDGTGADPVAGDGIYNAFIDPGLTGLYRLTVDATGASAGGAFQRSVASEFRVVSRDVQLDGSFQDRGIDQDGDGRLDEVGVLPRGTVAAPGRYALTALLRASNGNSTQTTTVMDLPAGPQTIEVRFTADALRTELGVDGPYQVEVARVERVEPAGTRMADERYELGATAPYLLSDLARPAILLTGDIGTQGVDFDANGLFDRLDVTVGVDVLNAGTYQFTGNLSDSRGVEIDFSPGRAFFAAGGSAVTLRFSGEKIGTNGIDGPFQIRNLLMFGPGASTIIPLAGFTEALPARLFEGYVAQDVTPPVLHVSVTPDGWWPPTHDMIEVVPTVVVVDDYDADPEVRLESVTSNEAPNAFGDGNTSPDIEIDPVTGHLWLRGERSGTDPGRVYTITWSARDDAGNSAMASATFSIPHDQGRLLSEGPPFIAASAPGRGSRTGSWNFRWAAASTLAVDQVEFRLRADASSQPELIASADAGAGQLYVPALADVPPGAWIEAVGLTAGQDVAARVLPVPEATSPALGSGDPAPATLSIRVVLGPRRTPSAVEFDLPSAGDARVEVFDVNGARRVTLLEGWRPAGRYTVPWTAHLPSGMYFVRLKHGAETVGTKAVVLN
jgi:hypothetical protein